MLKALKILKNILFALLVLIVIVLIFSQGHVYKKEELAYGVTYSKKQASALNLDWQKAYLAILDELGVKKIRLPVYWDEVEAVNNQYNWPDLDWQITQAGDRGAEIILAIGNRLPRWPECHWPAWAKNLSLEERRAAILEYEREVINHYKDKGQIIAWQIENEPFLSSYFGECPKLDKKFLDQEIATAKKLDSRPIVITDSGELSFWLPAARRADIFGTTMYRDTYSTKLKRYIHYPIRPGFFKFKRNIARLFASPQEWLVIELQAEPWGPRPYQYLSQAEKDKTMNLGKFREILEFARLTGFKTFYLWGVEWWYWEKEINNKPETWNEAKRLFTGE